MMPSVEIKLILKVNPALCFSGTLTLVKFGDAPGSKLIDTGFTVN